MNSEPLRAEFLQLRDQIDTGLSRASRRFSVIEAFCGPGGMSLGLQQAGFSVIKAFDIDPPSVATHNRNLGNHAFVGDAQSETASSLLSGTDLEPGDLDLFAGGPPCQGFSKQKRGAHLGDLRNELVRE